MSSISINISERKLQSALAKQPEALKKNMSVAISQIVARMARSAKLKAPKAFSILTNSIKSKRLNAFTGQVTAATDYASFVEEGRKPGGKMPPLSAINDWIKVSQIEPNNPDMSDDDLSFVIRRSIAIKGTRPQPFMQPALDENKAWALNRINKAIDQSLGLV